MQKRIYRWLNSVHVVDPIQQQQVVTLQILLCTVIAGAVLGAMIFQYAPLSPLVRAMAAFASLQIAVAGVIAFVLVRRSFFLLAIVLIIISTLIAAAVAMIALGLGIAGGVLFVLSVPVSFAGLLGNRRLLLLTASTIACMVVAVYLLEPLTQPIFSSASSPEPLSLIGIFLLALIILTVFSSTFAAALRHALVSAAERERTLERMGASLEDMVEQRTAELQAALAELRESELRQRAIIDALPDIICRLNRDGICLYFHFPRFVPLPSPLFSASEKMIGRSVYQLIPRSDAHEMMRHIGLALASNELQRFERYRTGLEGQQDFEVRVLACGDNQVLAIVRDITERQRVDRLKSEFLSVVSHELRTPLTSIRGAIGLVAGGVTGAISPQAQAMLDIAANNSERLVRLINDLLDIEKIESGKMRFEIRRLAMNTLIERSVVDNQAYGTYYSVSLVTCLATGDLHIMGDSDRIGQVLANLISNAVKYAPRGSAVQITSVCRGQIVRVEVSDQGPGIDPAFRTQLFQKFAQADAADSRPKGGSGLGLSISRAIIEGCGGQIGYEPGVAGGSRFYFELPLVEG